MIPTQRSLAPLPPSAKTLAKYGLSEKEWLAILERQFGVCAVCGKVPSTGRLCVDHDHVRGWKKLPPEKRKLHVRGLLCFWCNKCYVGRSITLAKSEAVTRYLTAHNERVLDFAMGRESGSHAPCAEVSHSIPEKQALLRAGGE